MVIFMKLAPLLKFLQLHRGAAFGRRAAAAASDKSRSYVTLSLSQIQCYQELSLSSSAAALLCQCCPICPPRQLMTSAFL
jgi:hypothetical protein